MKTLGPKSKSIMDQVNAMRCKFPDATITKHITKLKVIMNIRPTSRSVSYKVLIKYKLGEYPKIWVLSPGLHKNNKKEDIPHMYGQERLCLFQPKYGEFKSSDQIADTIIPWISLWLYHYENWHLTGTWQGGGEHPELNNKYENRQKIQTDRWAHWRLSTRRRRTPIPKA